MTTTLCGHERGVMGRALRGWDLSPVTTQNIIEGGGDFSDAERDARRDANDPAKLAELIAMEARRRGVDAVARRRAEYGKPGLDLNHDVVLWDASVTTPDAILLDVRGFCVWLIVPTLNARTILLALLQLPDGAPHEDAERVLRGKA